MCVLDIACAAGETAVIMRNTTAVMPPDANAAGILSPIMIPTAGLVRRVIVSVSVSHTNDADVDVYLTSPYGVQRDLTSDNGGTNDNYTMTLFDDASPNLVTLGAAPFIGTFRPEQTISDAFGNQSAAGEWQLRVIDDLASTATGQLDRWSLALCVDTSAASVCGNGYVEAAESCDDFNTELGDGCSASCQIELACAAGQIAVITRSTAAPQIFQDANTTGTSMPITIGTGGTVRRAVVVVGAISHAFDGDIDLSLISPMTTTLDVSSDNGSGGDDYVATMLDDRALASIALGTVPFRGSFQPETALAGVNGQASAGTWLLKAVDDAGGDAGVLSSWVLGLCVE